MIQTIAQAVIPANDLLPLALPTLVAAAAYFMKRRADALERRRELCARALACVFEWMETPYRIRRRSAGDSGARVLVATAIHDLQERLAFHQAWLRIEIPQLADPYETLCGAAKAATARAAQEAWISPGIESDADMNVGNLGITRPREAEEAFARAVRHELSLWRGLLPW
ncbi:MAG: hypothetical protein AB7G21_14285 [Dehalococcoidia bacterium]